MDVYLDQDLRNATARQLAGWAPKWLDATDWAYFGPARLSQLLADLTDEVQRLRDIVVRPEPRKVTTCDTRFPPTKEAARLADRILADKANHGIHMEDAWKLAEMVRAGKIAPKEDKYPPSKEALRLADRITSKDYAGYGLEYVARRLATLVKQGRISHFSRSTEGVKLVQTERLRQIDEEGCTPEGDDGYDNQLIRGALAYLHNNSAYWPDSWTRIKFKSKSAINNYVRAGALICAEIDRLLRSKEQEQQVEPKSSGPGNPTITGKFTVKSDDSTLAQTLQARIEEMVKKVGEEDTARLENELTRLLAAGYKQEEIEILERNGQRWAAVKPK